VDMYKREVSRARQQQTRMVERSTCTKRFLDQTECLPSQNHAGLLNNRCKIKVRYLFIQQEEVLTELYSYTHQEPPPPNVATTIEAHKYLEACSLMFEKGFLCHDKICSMNSTVLQNIFQGYKYFTDFNAAF